MTQLQHYQLLCSACMLFVDLTVVWMQQIMVKQMLTTKNILGDLVTILWHCASLLHLHSYTTASVFNTFLYCAH